MVKKSVMAVLYWKPAVCDKNKNKNKKKTFKMQHISHQLCEEVNAYKFGNSIPACWTILLIHVFKIG